MRLKQLNQKLNKDYITPSVFYDFFKKIKSEILINLIDIDDDPKYPEINKLKPLVRDADGVLNLYKLADLIEQNKASLAKYLDE